MTAVAWFKEGDRWIPSLFVGAFLIILAVNGTMIWLALSTFGGLATADYYDRGRTYNETLETAEAMAALGWQVEVVSTPQEDGMYLMEATLLDDDGAPLLGAEVTGNLVRPSSDDQDMQVVLVAQEDGRWAVPVAAGLWELRLLVERDGMQLASGHRLELVP